jgi:hypothetical protein
VARARVISAAGAALPVPSGPIGLNAVVSPRTSGTLVLAEASGGWSATLNGRPLAPLALPVDGWAQGFVLPVGGGRLVITRNELARDLSLAGEAAAVLVVFALALPGTRSAVPVPAGEAEAGPETSPAPGRRRERANGTKPARRKRRPQFALAVGRTRAAGPDVQAETQDTPEYPADTGSERQPLTDPGAPAPPGTGSPADAPRRPRGQHAARHGKPSRRRRGPAKAPSGPSAPAIEDLDGDEDISSWVTPDPMTTGSHAPWESGDRP